MKNNFDMFCLNDLLFILVDNYYIYIGIEDLDFGRHEFVDN